MKRIIAVLVTLLLCSTAAFAGTSLRVGGLYGKYNDNFGPLRMDTNGFGGYVGLTSYLDVLPIGFTGSYSLFMADQYTVTGSLEVEEPETDVHEVKNSTSLLKAFAGYTLPGFGITLGGGWVSLTCSVEEFDPYTMSGAAIAAFADIPVTPALELSAEAFYAPKADYNGFDGTGMGAELRGSYAVMPLVGVDVGVSAVKFTLKDTEGIFVQDMRAFAGVKLSF